MVGGALLRPPTSFSFCNRPGGASHATPDGLNFNDCPGGTVRAAPADLLGVVSLSGSFSTALASVAFLPLCLSLMGRLGPSIHGLP